MLFLLLKYVTKETSLQNAELWYEQYKWVYNLVFNTGVLLDRRTLLG